MLTLTLFEDIAEESRPGVKKHDMAESRFRYVVALKNIKTG